MITQARLKELLHYDAELGWFMWRTGPRSGHVAGSLNKILGYVVIGIDYKDYYAHRLAFLYKTGLFPAHDGDHRDRNKTNNRWRNLRSVTKKQNQENKSRPRGVYRLPSGRWVAKLKHHQVSIHLGTYGSKKAAAKARRDAERLYFTHAP